jgi:hypothetical protein
MRFRLTDSKEKFLHVEAELCDNSHLSIFDLHAFFWTLLSLTICNAMASFRRLQPYARPTVDVGGPDAYCDTLIAIKEALMRRVPH